MIMSNVNFTTTISTDRTPGEVFDAINNVRGWWTENLEGNSSKLNDEFEVRFGDVHYSKQRLTEVVPGKKVVWLVTDSRLSFVKDKSEWTDTRVSFEILSRGSKTELRFTHIGLVPDFECHEACTTAWSGYVNVSLKKLIETGRGDPERSK